jgi:hypothetical protein
MSARVSEFVHATSCVWFWAWVLVGSGLAFGVVSFGLGPFVFIPAAIGAVFLARRQSARSSAFGLLSGAGLLFLFIAWVQRRGPGTTCWSNATSSGCGENLNPLPWLIAGVVLLAAGVVAQSWFQRYRFGANDGPRSD